jgi:hypothetical protein
MSRFPQALVANRVARAAKHPFFSRSAQRSPLRGLGRGGNGAQALVELALTLPALVALAAALFQLGLLFVVYLSMVHASRDVARWLAVHPDTTDTQFQAYVSADMPSTISGANLTAQALPACPTLAAGHCTGRSAGAALHIRMTYDAHSVVFLPSLRLGFINYSIPTVLPPYDYWVMVEAH